MLRLCVADQREALRLLDALARREQPQQWVCSRHVPSSAHLAWLCVTLRREIILSTSSASSSSSSYKYHTHDGDTECIPDGLNVLGLQYDILLVNCIAQSRRVLPCLTPQCLQQLRHIAFSAGATAKNKMANDDNRSHTHTDHGGSVSTSSAASVSGTKASTNTGSAGSGGDRGGGGGGDGKSEGGGGGTRVFIPFLRCWRGTITADDVVGAEDEGFDGGYGGAATAAAAAVPSASPNFASLRQLNPATPRLIGVGGGGGGRSFTLSKAVVQFVAVLVSRAAHDVPLAEELVVVTATHLAALGAHAAIAQLLQQCAGVAALAFQQRRPAQDATAVRAVHTLAAVLRVVVVAHGERTETTPPLTTTTTATATTTTSTKAAATPTSPTGRGSSVGIAGGPDWPSKEVALLLRAIAHLVRAREHAHRRADDDATEYKAHTVLALSAFAELSRSVPDEVERGGGGGAGEWW